MTDANAVPASLVLDATCLSHFARADRLDVLRDLLLAVACREGKLTPAGAASLIDALRATGHRLPCTGAGFPGYARQHGLL